MRKYNPIYYYTLITVILVCSFSSCSLFTPKNPTENVNLLSYFTVNPVCQCVQIRYLNDLENIIYGKLVESEEDHVYVEANGNIFRLQKTEGSNVIDYLVENANGEYVVAKDKKGFFHFAKRIGKKILKIKPTKKGDYRIKINDREYNPYKDSNGELLIYKISSNEFDRDCLTNEEYFFFNLNLFSETFYYINLGIISILIFLCYLRYKTENFPNSQFLVFTIFAYVLFAFFITFYAPRFITTGLFLFVLFITTTFIRE